MAVSHDAYSKMTAEARGPGNPASHSWTHTPSGTPKGVLVWAVTGPGSLVSGDDAVTGVTYGGVSMTKVGEVFIASGGERGAAYLYELLSGIPTGAQTVSVTVNGMPTSVSASYPWWMCMAVTMASGGGSLVRIDSDSITSAGTANPSVTMDATTRTGISYLGGFSAVGTMGSISAGTNCTLTGSGYDYTNSDDVAFVVRQTTPATGTFAIGYTAASDDVAMLAATYYESSQKNPMGTMGFFG